MGLRDEKEVFYLDMWTGVAQNEDEIWIRVDFYHQLQTRLDKIKVALMLVGNPYSTRAIMNIS